jgi:hypothetical protein
MTLRLTRRATLLLPLLVAACGDDDEVPAPAARHDFPPLRYGYLPPIKLNVQRLEMAGDFTLPTGADEMIGFSPVDPVDTLDAMARDRLKPVAQNGIASFSILTASITRRRDTMNGVLAVRLDVHNGDNRASGYAEARVIATHSGTVSDQRGAVYDMLKSMMSDMNVELEYQLRNKLKSWVADDQAAPRPAPASAPSAPEPVDPSAEPPPRS